MKSLIRASSFLLLAGVLIVACSKPAGRDTQTTPTERTGTVATPAVSAPVEKTPSDQTPEPAKEQNQKATPPPKAPAKKQPKPAIQPGATAESAAPTQVPPPAPTPPLPQPVPSTVAEAPPPVRENPPVVSAPSTRHITVAANTTIAIRTIDSIDSRTDQAGQTFRASIDSDVIVDNDVVVRRGDDAYLKLILATSAGELRGKSELQLQLERIVIGKKSYMIESNVVERSAAAEGPKTARDIGIGAAIGAAIGAIAGGGKGAAIGAGAGAGAGAAVAAITKGEQVLVPSETRLEFRLERPVEIELRAPPPSPTPSPLSSSGPRKLGEDSSVSSKGTASDRQNVSNVLGEWRLSIEGPQRTRRLRLFLEQDGKNLRGTISGTLEGEIALRGKVEGDSITFTTESRLRDRTVESKYTGKISDDRLRGTVTMRVVDGYAGRLGRGARRPNEKSANWTAERAFP